MIFFYIRHGDPIYNPDSLTPLGKRQAEAIAKRLSLYGIDRIYSSTSNRAIMTANPTCEILKKEMTLLDFCNESHVASEFGITREAGWRWIFQDEEIRQKFSEKEVRDLADKWYEHPEFTEYKKGVERVYNDCDEFFKSLGYEHIKNSGKYKVIKPNNERIALFAHQGFSMAFFSTVLDIPYPQFSNHFDICHTGMTVMEFKEHDGFAIPKILTWSSDSHLYREGLPTNYNGELRF